MYSEKLEGIFKREQIALGDKISVEKKGKRHEGELMPSTESSDPEVIILKLASGYNIGVAYDDDTNITKLSATKRTVSFPEAKITPNQKLPKVAIIYTGGTIGSKVDYLSGGTYPLIKPAELLAEVPELAQIANITIESPFSIWSEDMSYIEWQKIAVAVAHAVSNGARGVVVTMGTDTMHYAAAALGFMLRNLNAPIVITGAQRSSDRGSSDAFMNLVCATSIAANSDVAEVCICMHHTSSDQKCSLLRGVKARKMHTSRRDAFRPINESPIAYVDADGTISYQEKYIKLRNISERFDPKINYEEKVALIKAYPNSDPSVIDFYLQKGYKGIILEGTGLGNLPISIKHKGKSWHEHIKNAIENGVVIGITSQCIYGRVHPNVYRTMRIISSLGVVYCEDMLAETALVKLGWLLGNYSPQDAKELLTRNIIGEIKQRSVYDEFLM